MKLGDTLNLLVIAAAVGVSVFVYRKSGTISKAAAAGLDAINPTNQNNIFYEATNAPIQWITGDPSATLGSKIYDFTVAIGINKDAGAIATAPTPLGKSKQPDTVDLGAYANQAPWLNPFF